MTRLELAKLQLSRASKPKNFLGDDWLFFWLIIRREEKKLADIMEIAARAVVTTWDQAALEDHYQGTLRGMALEVRGPRNEDPAENKPMVCRCKGCTGDTVRV